MHFTGCISHMNSSYYGSNENAQQLICCADIIKVNKIKKIGTNILKII